MYCPRHLYTYIAIVLEVHAATRTLTLQYLSDGLGPDTDWEAFAKKGGKKGRKIQRHPWRETVLIVQQALDLTKPPVQYVSQPTQLGGTCLL